MSDEWEGGERQGIRWRRGAAAVVVVALIAGGVYVVRNRDQLAIDTGEGPALDVSEEVEVVSTAPLRAGYRWYCPSTYPVAVFDNGQYRPPEFPRARADERPEECYADVERAQNDGHELAPPPDDVVLAGDVYLEPTRSPTPNDCANLADWVGFTAPCPSRLPSPADGPGCDVDSCVYGDRDGIIMEHRHFRVPEDWPNDGPPQVVITAVAFRGLRRDGSLRIDGPVEFARCHADGMVLPEEQVQFVVCPPGVTWIPRFQGEPHENHTAAFWQRGNVAYGASVEGYGAKAEDLLHALIDGIEYVEPRDSNAIEGP